MKSERKLNMGDERTSLIHADDDQEKDDIDVTETEPLSKARQVVLVVALFLLNVFVYGFGLSLSVLYPVFADVFNSNRATAALIQSLYSSLGMGLSFLWNKLVIRFGCGRCIISGVCLTVLGIFLAQFATDIWTLIVFISIFGGTGCSIVGVGPYIIANGNVDKHKNAVMALLPVGASVGQFFFVTLTEYFIENYGWSGALLLMSGIQANMLPIALLIDKIDKPHVQRKNASSKTNKMFSLTIFKEWRLYILFVASFLFIFGAYVETKFIVDFAIVKGYEREVGSALASYLGLANAAGRLASFGLKMVIPGKSLLQASVLSLINASSHAIILYLDSNTYLLIGIIVNGVSLGMLVSIYLAALLEIFSPDDFGPAMSVSFIITGIGTFLGGYLGGYIRDLYGSYDLLFELATGSGVLMALSYVLLVISVTNVCRKTCK